MRFNIAPVGRGHELLAALCHPFHRTLQRVGAKRHGDVFRIGARLHAETAAHIAYQHAHFFLGPTDGVAHRVANAGGHLGAQPHRDALRRRVEISQHRAWLDGECHQPLVDDVERHHMRGPGEGCIRCVDAAVACLRRDVVRRSVANYRRTGSGGAGQVDHHRQFFVIDLHGFRCIACLLDRFGYHCDYRFPNEPHALMRQRVAWRCGRWTAVRTVEAGRPRHRLDTGCHQVGASDDAQHARHPGSIRHVDAADPGMRIRRANKNKMGLARQPDVIGVLTGSCQKRLIFQPKHGLAAAETQVVAEVVVSGVHG